jgi:hypothetical protein
VIPISPNELGPTNPLKQPWPELTGNVVTSFAIAGPYSNLEAVCVQLTADECEEQESATVEDPDGRILERAEIRAHYSPSDRRLEVREPPNDLTVSQRRHYAWRIKDGWWVTPYVTGMGGKGSFETTERLVGGHLVIETELTRAVNGMWDGQYISAFAVCAVGSGGMRCTPRMITGRSSFSTDLRDEPGSVLHPELACTASFADGKVTIMAATPNTHDGPTFPVHNPAAAAACSKLPYFGTRAVKLR